MLTHPQTTVSTRTRSGAGSRSHRLYQRAASSERGLWVFQGVLAAVFLFAGVMKLVTPAETLADQSPFPVLFLQFIGICETLGGLGLVLPGVLRIARWLTPLAAAGLVVIMSGAVVSTAATTAPAAAVVPLLVGLACAFVATARSHAAPAR